MNHRYAKNLDGRNISEDLRGEAQFTASLAALLGMLRNHRTDGVEQGVRQPQDHERNKPRNGGFDH